MKIRTDFVTNSSSSSYSVEVSIISKSGNVYIEACPFSEDIGSASFEGDLQKINKHLSSVEELATWLAESLTMDMCDDDEMTVFEEEKAQFIDEARTKIKSVRDIESVIVNYEYNAYGEFADLVADNDKRLRELAEKYVHSTGIEQERAEAEMITYIHSTTEARGESFGWGYHTSRYYWKGHSVKELAERLVSSRGPDSVSGSEREELNLKTGEYFNESTFDLK